MGWLEKVIEAFADKAEEFISGVLDGLALLFGPSLYRFLQKGVSMYNALADASVSLITADPKTYNSDLWDIVSGFNNALMAVSAIVAVVLLLINFCTSSVDVRENVRLETMLKLFIKISLCSFFITQNMQITGAVMGAGQYIVGKAGSSGAGRLSFGAGLTESAFKNSGDEILLVIFLTGIAFLVLVSSGFLLLLAAYKRLFKLLLIIPYGGLAFAAIAGDRDISRHAVAYVKYILGTFLEAATMLLILRLMAVLNFHNPSGLLNNTGLSAFNSIYGNLVMLCFNSMITVGLVTEADSLVHRALLSAF